MKKEIPPNDISVESFDDNRELPPNATEEQKIADIMEASIEKSHKKELSNEDKEKIRKIKESISSEGFIKKSLEKKDTGEERYVDTRPAHEKKPWLSRITTMFSLAALLGTAQKSEGKNLENTVSKKSSQTESVSSLDTSKNTIRNIEKNKTFENKEIRELSQREMQEWNMFVDFVAEKGYKGSKELDIKGGALPKKLLKEFKEIYPDFTIDFSIVPNVQAAMHKIKESAQSFAKRRNDPNAEKLMSGISDIDGWPGSKTTQYKFPGLEYDQYHNDKFVSKTYVGLIDGTFKPTKGINESKSVSKPKQKIPPNVKIEKLQDGDYYEDPNTGDLVKIL